MTTVLVSGTFVVAWDTDDFRREWAAPMASDEEIMQECIQSVKDNWSFYAADADVVDLSGEIVG